MKLRREFFHTVISVAPCLSVYMPSYFLGPSQTLGKNMKKCQGILRRVVQKNWKGQGVFMKEILRTLIRENDLKLQKITVFARSLKTPHFFYSAISFHPPPPIK